MIWLAGLAYLWFGWHYADAVMRSAGIRKQSLAWLATGVLTLLWPLWFLMRLATKLAEW